MHVYIYIYMYIYTYICIYIHIYTYISVWRLALALFPVASLLNHDCDAPTHITFQPNVNGASR